MRFPDIVGDWVREQLMAEALQTEALAIEAFRLQRLDRIDRLTVIYRDGCAPTIASRAEA